MARSAQLGISVADPWDVDAYSTAFAFSPGARSNDEHGGGGGLSPEPDGDGGATWQDEFFALETSLLSGIAPPRKGAAAAAPPAAAPPASRQPSRDPAALLSLASGAANLRQPSASALQQPQQPQQPQQCQPGGVGGAASTRRRGTGTVGDASATSDSYRGHGTAGATTSSAGQTTADMGNGINMDKRRCRALNRDDFMAAIAQHRAAQLEQEVARPSQAPPPLPSSRRGATVGAAGGLGSVRGWVRKRPLLPHETSKGEYDAVSVERLLGGGGGGGSSSSISSSEPPPPQSQPTARRGSHVTTHCCLLKPDLRRMFIRHSTFMPNGGVLNEAATSDDAYAAFGVDLVDLALGGGRGTLLMYGQTGSGKTMTLSHMQARAAHHLFRGNDKLVASAVEVTAVEVAGRTVRDLHSGQACVVQQTKQGGATLKGAQPYVATSAEALAAHLERLMKSRTTEATAVNSTSSRSHALIALRIGVDGGCEGRLTLLDCAGSEWSADSDAHSAKRRKEGAEINASLHALKQCVRAQAEKARTGKGHVPYRDAVLTRLLRDSFEADGYDCRLAMVGCVSPGAADCEHTTSTLRCVMELSSAKASAEECTTSIQQVPRLKSVAAAEARHAAVAAAAEQWAAVGASHLVQTAAELRAAQAEEDGGAALVS